MISVGSVLITKEHYQKLKQLFHARFILQDSLAHRLKENASKRHR